MANSRILVLGIGNLLLGDEGVGIHAIRLFENEQWPKEVSFLDRGTGGFRLLSYLEDYPHVIIIDASLDDFQEGTSRHIRPKFASDFPPSLSAHEIGLKDLVDALVLLDQWPDIHLLAVSIKDLDRLSLELSPEVQNALEQIRVNLNRIIESILTSSKRENTPTT